MLLLRLDKKTMMGSIASLASSTKKAATPLQKEIKRFVLIISAIALTLGVTFFLLNIFRDVNNIDWVNAFVFTIGIIVANIPEGLLATLTVGLTLTAKRMSKKNVLVKNLESVETLGSVTAICTDKTGTITQNIMTVSHLFFNDSIWNCKTNENEKDQFDINSKVFQELNVVAAVCNNAVFEKLDEEEEAKIIKNEGSFSSTIKITGKGGIELKDMKSPRKSKKSRQAIIVSSPRKLKRKELEERKASHSTILSYKQGEEFRKSKDDLELMLENEENLDRESKELELNELFGTANIKRRKAIGSATEISLLKFCQQFGDVEKFRKKNKVCGEAEIPFNSKNKFQCSVHVMYHSPTNSTDENQKNKEKLEKDYMMVMKGATEKVLDYCKYILFEDQRIELNEEWKSRILLAVEKMASFGERVLGFARYYYPHNYFPKDVKFDKEFVKNMELPRRDLVFIGLMSMIDPPKLGVAEAVQKCKTAQIKVIMITGDHPSTAVAIAKQVGILSHPTKEDTERNHNLKSINEKEIKATVVHGSEINDFTQNDWDRVLEKEEIVFARTTPQHKLMIVRNLQRREEVVAMTGDGINDSPALKKADIGVSMQISGSDASKNAADMILLDDNFCSIVNGIQEGRVIFDNLKKSIAYTLSSNIPEIVPFLIFIALGVPLPLGTILILCVDLGTDLIPAISFAHEKPESDILSRPPRNPKKDSLVNLLLIGFSYLQIGVIQALAGLFSYAVVMAEYGFPLPWLLGKGRNHFFTSRVIEDLAMKESRLVDYFGIKRGYEYQQTALKTAQTAVFASIIVVQIADLLICKTRQLSFFQQGFRNNFALFGLVSEILLGLICVYTPGVNNILGTKPLAWYHWLLPLPFSFFIFIFDELRKWALRHGIGQGFFSW